MLPTTYETVRIETTPRVCSACESYARKNAAKPVVVMCCEGACLRGEIARRAANVLCHELAPATTVRLCLGGAFTKDGGQRALVRNGHRVIAIEGCFLECASRMMRAVVPGLAPEVIVADRLYEFDRNLFGIDEMPEDELTGHAWRVASQVAQKLPAIAP